MCERDANGRTTYNHIRRRARRAKSLNNIGRRHRVTFAELLVGFRGGTRMVFISTMLVAIAVFVSPQIFKF